MNAALTLAEDHGAEPLTGGPVESLRSLGARTERTRGAVPTVGDSAAWRRVLKQATQVAERGTGRSPSYTSLPSAPAQGLSVAENGSYYGEPNANGVPKTVHVNGYYRKDGTYVRGHYRSAPNSNPPKSTGRRK